MLFKPPAPLPCLKVVDGLLHSFLVVADHVLVHVGIVGADVLLRAAVWNRAETQRWVLLCRLLKLHGKNRWAEIKVTGWKREVKRGAVEKRERS